jgi:hypothetical protein
MADQEESVTRRELLTNAGSGLRRLAAEFLERRLAMAADEPADVGFVAGAEGEQQLDTLETILAKLPRASDEDMQVLLTAADPVRDHPRLKKQAQQEEEGEQPA